MGASFAELADGRSAGALPLGIVPIPGGSITGVGATVPFDDDFFRNRRTEREKGMGLFSSIKDNLSHAYQVIARDAQTGAYPIWRHPSEDFRNGSVLQVAEDDVALLMDNGKLVESFTGGRYTLATSNYPFLDRLRASFSGGENSYKYTVFFISKRPMPGLMWGTREPMEVAMQMALPIPGAVPSIIPVKLQIGVNYTATIADPKTFLLKDVEGTTAVTRSQDELNKLILRPRIGQCIKSNIAKAIQSVEGGIWSVQTQTENIAANLENALNDSFAEHGLRLDHLYIDTLNVLDTEEWLAFKKERADFGTYQMKMAKEAMGEMQQINALDNNWQRIQARDIMKAMSGNPGAGGIAAAGAGLGMGMAAGGVLGSMSASMFAPMQESAPQPQPAAPSQQAKCPHCGEMSGGGKFCGNCGRPIPRKCTCPGCGTDVPDGFKFCPDCGAKIN